MTFPRLVALVATAILSFSSVATAGTEAVSRRLNGPTEIVAPSFEVAVETSYLLGSLANPNSYEIASLFITGRWRWGMIERDSWLRGYNQFYFLAMAEPIIRGPENFYYGVSAGFRYNFVQPGWRLTPYISGGVGLGWIDSHADVFGAQGQDFTFNILTAVGVSYRVNDKVSVTAGALYQHLSNGGQTDPNPSLNLFGPQIGVTWNF